MELWQRRSLRSTLSQLGTVKIRRVKSKKSRKRNPQRTKQNKMPDFGWVHRCGQGAVMACLLFVYLYCMIGKTQWSSAHLFGPIIPTLSSWMFSSHDKATVPLVTMVVPLLVAGSVAMLLSKHQRTYNSKSWSWSNPWYSTMFRSWCQNRGEWNVRSVRLWLLLGPWATLTMTTLLPKMPAGLGAASFTSKQTMADVANGWAIIALWALAFLFLPVAQYSPILQLFSGLQHPPQSIILHQCLGYLVMIGVVFHVALHGYRWVILQDERLLRQFVLPDDCWRAARTVAPSALCDTVDTPVTNDCTCYGRFRNVAGLIATLALLAIMATTIVPHIRRKWYALFYTVHRVAGPLVVLGTILHWNRSVMYLAGGLLYYLACSVPVWCERYCRSRRQDGVRICSVERLGATVVALTVEAAPAAMQLYHPGQYVHVQVPELSRVAHPFSINAVVRPEEAAHHRLRILFRCVGPFTNALAQRLMGKPSKLPILHMQGCFGSTRRLEQMQKHDHVVLVAGGIGITPYLSLLYAAVAAQSPRQIITLHWVCRDPELMDYVQREYWHPVLDLARRRDRRVQIVIHRTDPPVAMGRSYSNCGHNAAYDRVPDLDNADEEREISVLDSPGEPFVPSQVFPGSRLSYAANVPSFVAFCLIAWTGLVILWYCYNWWPAKQATLPRLIAPLLIWILCVVVSTSVYWCFADRSFDPLREPSAGEWIPVQQGDDHTEEVECSLPRSSSLELGCKHTVPQSNGPNTRNDTLSEMEEEARLPMEIRQGRPTVYQFLNSLDGSREPGLFVCGPPCLLRDVRVATQERCLQRLRQCIECRSAIALYEETFEL
jgi:predicted ferric reductase